MPPRAAFTIEGVACTLPILEQSTGAKPMPLKIPRFWVFVLGGIAGLVAALVAGLVWRGEYATTQTARRTFTIDEDFTAVRKILVRNDSAKQIVTMGGGSVFISQEWSAGGAELGTLDLVDPKWRLELHGTLRVRTKDPYIGEHEINLDQEVQITPDRLDSHVKLMEPSERLRQYDMQTTFARGEEGKARVDLELTQEILTDAPWFAHGIADRRVLASAEKTLENQEAAIKKLIAEHIDDVPLFPLR
jgi:hypothetical protein